MSIPGWHEANHAMWDELVPIHAASEFYDLPAMRAGHDPLRRFEIDEMGDVTGKRLLHLQCHIGTDTLSWARHGATVTGLDFSGRAVEAARNLANELGIPGARFVESDVYSARSALGRETYDIVYTGIGALCLLPDLPRWAGVVASLLAPGGFLYLAEFHPAGMCLGESGASIAHDYFDRGPHIVDEPGSYADRNAQNVNTRSFEWRHPLGDVVSALAAAGLRLDFLHEHDFTLFEPFPGMVRAAEGYRIPPGNPRLPLLFSLRATR